MLERIGRWSYHHRKLMLLIWIVALVAAIFLQGAVGGDYSTDFSLPGADSQKAFDLLEERFPQVAGDTADIVFKADAGVDDPDVKKTMESFFGDIAKVDRVVGIDSPYSPQGAGQVAQDGKIAFATIHFEHIKNEVVPIEVANEIKDLAASAQVDGLVIEPGGSVIVFSEFQQPGGAEGIGMLFAMVILLITFGSVLAMGLPIGVALFGIAIGLSLVMLFANFLSVPEFTPQLASMIGIGVGIDYALFIVTRYRQQIHRGLDPEQATMVAITTAGKAVLFAGTTVVISLLGILLMGFAFVEGLAVGGAATVAVTMVASITLLPALIGFVGRNIDRWRLPWFHQKDTDFEKTPAYRWSRLIQRRPWPAAIAGLLVLLVMSIPLFSIRLGFADASSGGTDRSSRRAYDLLSEGFGPGFNGPLLLATDVNSPEDLAKLEAVGAELAKDPGVAFVAPAQSNQEGNAAILTAFPTTSPQDDATRELVARVRTDIIAKVSADHPIYVGGLTAATVDFADANANRLPTLIIVVISLSFLLLVLVFRSIVVPLKAAVMNLLSIGAAYGAIVAIFQWGWLKGLVGIQTSGPIEAWVPMMLFTILFGLSMDYEIFLLSRIREEYVKTGNNEIAVANGLATTARVITAAAAIMVTLFLTFVFGFEERAIKLFGTGLAVAIFVDATLVRMILVPATMELLGDANWWLPKWLDRILPHVHIEGEDTVIEHVLEETGGIHDTEVILDEPEPVGPSN
ncbi:MAG: putative drug exporter of the superfamily [Actinomycetota bacterium]|nr:putative drug exporter of the superfamily [Actinomycetota bacterium]